MPEYPFRTPAGEIIHRVYAMKDAPSIGEPVNFEDYGRCVRLASDCQVNGDPLSGRYPHESFNISAAEARKRGLKFSPRGVPVFQNASQERGFASEYGYGFD